MTTPIEFSVQNASPRAKTLSWTLFHAVKDGIQAAKNAIAQEKQSERGASGTPLKQVNVKVITKSFQF